MTREKLETLSYPVLQQLAKKVAVFRTAGMGREKLVDTIFEAMSEDREESTEHHPHFWSEMSKYDLNHDNIDLVNDSDLELDNDHLASYLTVLQRDYSWFYVLWNLSFQILGKNNLKPDSQLFLLLVRLVNDADGSQKVEYSSKIPVKVAENSRYVNLLWKKSSRCWAELCVPTKSRLQPLLRSQPFCLNSPVVPTEEIPTRQRQILQLSGLTRLCCPTDDSGVNSSPAGLF